MTAENDHDILIGLNAKIDSIIDRLSSIDGIEKRVRDLEINNGCIGENIKIQQGEVSKLRAVNAAWSTLNTLGGIILAAIVGWINR